MRRRNFENFPTTKSSCGTRWGKKREEWLYPCLEDGRRMMRRTPKKQNKTKKKKKKNHEKIKRKPTPVQPPPSAPKIKILSNPAAGPKSIQKRDVHMCITGEKQTKQNATEKRTPCHATVHTTGSGGKEWGYEFLCQHGEMYSMYECVWLHMLPLYEGRVPCSLEYETSHYTLLFRLFLRPLGVLRLKRPFYFNNLPVKEANSRL